MKNKPCQEFHDCILFAGLILEHLKTYDLSDDAYKSLYRQLYDLGLNIEKEKEMDKKYKRNWRNEKND